MNEKIVFLGTPSMSAYVLEGMINAGFNIVAVISQEDKEVGRKKVLTPSKVSEVALKYGIPLYRPHKLNKEYDFLVDLKPDLLLTFAYGQIISTKVLALSRFKPLNLHASLLPKYRGAAPIQYALRNGEKKTGISLMEMVKEMDAGDVYAKEEIAIDEEDNYSSLCEKIQILALDMAKKYLPLYFDNKLEPVKQDESLVTFCPSIKREEEKLDLNLCAEDFVNYVRSLADNVGAYLMLDGEIFKIFKAKKVNSILDHEVGVIVKAYKKELLLQLKDGQVNLLKVQKQGKKVVSNVDFINGNKNVEGKKLS